MAKAQWLIQGNHPSFMPAAEIKAAVAGLGRSAFLCALSNGSSEPDFPSDLRFDAPIVCYGPSFVPRALRWPSFQPGIFFNSQTFRWSAFRQGWRDRMLNEDAHIVKAGAYISQSQPQPSVFARPDEDTKAFDGGPYDADRLSLVIENAIAAGRLTETTDIVLSMPKHIEFEWRMFIVDGDVVGASSYRRDGKAAFEEPVPYRVVDFAFDAAAVWAPAKVFCLDIGQVTGKLGVIEANCFNASRLYNADPLAVYQAVSELVEVEFGSAP